MAQFLKHDIQNLTMHRRALETINGNTVALCNKNLAKQEISMIAQIEKIKIDDINAYETSDDEVFFGAVKEKETKKAAKLKNRRRTLIHNVQVCDHIIFQYFYM